MDMGDALGGEGPQGRGELVGVAADRRHLALGEVAVQTRKTYVSLVTPRRTFVRVQATTLKRIDVALRLEAAPGGRLVKSRQENMPVQFGLASIEEFDEEAVELMRRTYEANV